MNKLKKKDDQLVKVDVDGDGEADIVTAKHDDIDDLNTARSRPSLPLRATVSPPSGAVLSSSGAVLSSSGAVLPTLWRRVPTLWRRALHPLA
eukprot:4728955-Prymnesium_polylepis.2